MQHPKGIMVFWQLSARPFRMVTMSTARDADASFISPSTTSLSSALAPDMYCSAFAPLGWDVSSLQHMRPIQATLWRFWTNGGRQVPRWFHPDWRTGLSCSLWMQMLGWALIVAIWLVIWELRREMRKLYPSPLVCARMEFGCPVPSIVIKDHQVLGGTPMAIGCEVIPSGCRLFGWDDHVLHGLLTTLMSHPTMKIIERHLCTSQWRLLLPLTIWGEPRPSLRWRQLIWQLYALPRTSDLELTCILMLFYYNNKLQHVCHANEHGVQFRARHLVPGNLFFRNANGGRLYGKPSDSKETQLHAVFSQWRQIALDIPEHDLIASASAFHELYWVSKIVLLLGPFFPRAPAKGSS